MFQPRHLIVVFCLALLLGCSSAPLALNYTPSSLIQGKGSVQVQEFVYDPAVAGEVKDDQIKNTAIGRIRLGRPVGPFVTEAFAAEFKYAGYMLENGRFLVIGDIQDFMADDLGFSVDWTLKMKVQLKSPSGKVLATKDIEIKKKLEKFSGFITSLNLLIKEAFVQMMSDPKFKQAIH
jgi:hypothetical protein